MLDDVHPAQHGQRDEIDQHDGAEHQPDLGGAARLDREQADQDSDRGRDDIGRKPACTVVRPSTADRTEIAGVIMLSP